MSSSLASLIEASLGKIPCDLLIRGGMVLNVFTRRFERADLAVFQGIVAGTGERPAHNIVDADGCFIVPGFIDGHVHLESSMLTPENYAAAVLPLGTTSVIADPHEYANVAGAEAVRYLERASEYVPLDIHIGIPSCVPATGMEHSGAVLSSEDIAALKELPHVAGLAEMMNYPGVLFEDPEVLAKLEVMRGRHIDGHAPCLSGAGLQAYIAAGVTTDHECTTVAEAREKLSLGMNIMLREGSVTRDLEALAGLVDGTVLERCLMVTDDREPEDLVKDGHMDFVCRKAISLGIDPVYVFIMASWGAARCFGLPRLGALAPGYKADFAILKTSDESFKSGFTVAKVFKNGKLMAEDGRPLWNIRETPRAGRMAENSVSLAPLSADALRVESERAGVRRVRVIEVKPDTIISGSLVENMTASEYEDANSGSKGFEIKADAEAGILKAAVFERHKAAGNIGIGFIRGLGLKKGAIASTVAHDSHNLIVVGANDADMLACVKTAADMGGGLAVVSEGKVLAKLPLPVCGLVSDKPLAEVYAGIEEVYRAAESLGASLKRPFMSLAFMALPVVPHLKLSDCGLVDVDKFALTGIFAD